LNTLTIITNCNTKIYILQVVFRSLKSRFYVAFDYKYRNKFQLYKHISIKMNTFFKRLIQVTEKEGFKNLNDFALNGLKYDSSSKLNRLKDENKKPSVEILEDIANKFQNINLHWLVTGKGEIEINSKSYGFNETILNLSEPGQINEVVTAQKKTITILEREVDDLRSDKDFLKNVIESKLGKVS
jgi:hypothetical protein